MCLYPNYVYTFTQDLHSSGSGTSGTTLGRFKNLFGGKSKSHAAITRTSTTVSQSNSNARHPSGGDGDHSDDDDDDEEVHTALHLVLKVVGDYLVYSKTNS